MEAEEEYSTPFSLLAHRMLADKDAADEEQTERIKRTFMHKFVHSKDIELRARQLLKRVALKEKARSGLYDDTLNSHDQEFRLMNLRLFDPISSDDSDSECADTEKRVFRGTFEMESLEEPASNRATGAKKWLLSNRGRSTSPRRHRLQRSTRAGSQSPARTDKSILNRVLDSTNMKKITGKTKNYETADKSQTHTYSRAINSAESNGKIEPLEPELIRWFYREAPSKKWTPFCGYDSLRLECKHRELAARKNHTPANNNQSSLKLATSATTRDKSNVRAATKPSIVKLKNTKSGDSQTQEKSELGLSTTCQAQTADSTSVSAAGESVRLNPCDDLKESGQLRFTDGHYQFYDEPVTKMTDSAAAPAAETVDNEPIIVRGGLYEVHVSTRICRPIYWEATSRCEVMRGTWFMASSGEALNESLADAIESEHLATFMRRLKPASSTKSTNVLRSWLKKSTASQAAQNGQKKVEFQVETVDEKSSASFFSVKRPLHEMIFRNFAIEWYSAQEVSLYQDTNLLVNVLPRLGINQRSGGMRLRRGYSELCTVEDKPPEISHLIFVIHGIGQKAYAGAIADCCDSLRMNATKLIAENYPSITAGNSDRKRVEFFPVEWRSALKLDGDTVASVTPPHMRSIRTMLNSTVMDILYYTSPLYRAELTAGLRHEILRLYTMFCARNPYFEHRGQVSVIAHSLGAVIFYDVLTGWNPSQLCKQQSQSSASQPSDSAFSRETSIASMDESETDVAADAELQSHRSEFNSLISELSEARKHVNRLEARLLSVAERQHMLAAHSDFGSTPAGSDSDARESSRSVVFPNNCVTGCEWKQLPKIANFFCLGSPLSVFLTLRGVRPKGLRAQDQVFPPDLVQRVFNIYHPCDPIAYRLEPLLLKHYCSIRPLYVYSYYDALLKTPYSELPKVLIKPRKNASPDRPIPMSRPDANHLDSGLASYLTPPDDLDRPSSRGFSTELEAFKPKSGEVNGNYGRQIRKLFTKSTGDTDADADGDGDAVKMGKKVSTSTVDSIDYSNVDAAELEYRLDYELKESDLSVYIAVLRAHTSYWRNLDVLQFMLQHLFPDHPPTSAAPATAAK